MKNFEKGKEMRNIESENGIEKEIEKQDTEKRMT